ncbi:efflux RND transporter periplasmic adaptor subunit [Dyella marensis]|uniref:efflux RND transporter periplasmic adaptor subunit n=1 Tax=Dyella marensis TaxID=500610 RepID=UPI0031CF327B
MPWKKLLLIVLAVALLGVAMLVFRGRQETTPALGKGGGAQAGEVPVQVATATHGDVDLSLKLVGRAEAFSTVTLRSRVSGQLQTLAFKPGAQVKRGELLIQIDPSLLKAQLDQARGTVAKDQAQWVKAQADQQRYTDMLAKGFVSKADYDTYQANLGVAKATLQSDLALQETAQTQLDYARIVAPFDGVIGSPLVWPGAQITADSTDIVVLNQIEPMRIAFSIPEESLAALRAAQARGQVAVQAAIPGDKGQPLAGTLEFIDNAVDATTGTIVVKGRFENTDHRLTAGQFVQVTLPTTRIANAVSVPVEALQSSAKGSFVFVLGHDGKVQQRYITPGPTAGQRLVVDKGLDAGEQVVTEGQMLLVDGARAKVKAGGG